MNEKVDPAYFYKINIEGYLWQVRHDAERCIDGKITIDEWRKEALRAIHYIDGKLILAVEVSGGPDADFGGHVNWLSELR